MPESDETRELGGLARSIDALFSQRPSAPAVEPEVDEDPAPADEAENFDDAGAVDATEPGDPLDEAFEHDPFESLEAVDALDAVDELEAESMPDGPMDSLEGDGADVVPEEWAPDHAGVSDEDGALEEAVAVDADVAFEEDLDSEVDAPSDFGVLPTMVDTVDEETDEPPLEAESELDPEASLADDGLPLLGEADEEVDAVPAAYEAEPPAVPTGPAGAALAEAVDAFLAGHPGAGTKVEREARKLHDRLALDPLADAVERLVFSADDSEDDPALLMAGKLASPAVASRLVQRTVAEEDEARRAQYLSLGTRLGMVMANAYKGVLTEATDARTRRACYDGLIGMGDEGRPVIEAMIEDDNRFLVRNGIAILGEMGGEGAVELVTSALANTDFRVRREAVSALAKLGGEDSDQLIMASLGDGDATVRAAAAEAAGKLGIERALKPILALLDDDGVPDDEKIHVQVQALSALGHLGDPGAVQAIEKRATGSLFSKPPTEVRVAAYKALHAIGTPHARELIAKAKDDKDPVVRTTARGLGSD